MRLVTIVALLTALAASAFGGQNVWTESSPVAAQILQMYGDPSDPATAYASTALGYYRTTDQGATWTSFGATLPSGPVTAFFVTLDSSLYIAIDQTLFVSRDRGDHWDHVADFGAQIHAVVSDGVLYVATDGGVAYSRDGGDTWNQANLPATGTIVQLTLTANAVYAISGTSTPQGVVDSATLRSVDLGRTWKKIDRIANSLFGSAASASVYRWQEGGFFVSTDVGNSWTIVPPIANDIGVGTIAVDGADLYSATSAGIYLFRSGSWSRVSPAVDDLSAIAVSRGQVYIAPRAGILAFDCDSGVWRTGQGLPGANVADVAIADSDPSVRFAAVGWNNSYRSADGGVSWSVVDIQSNSGSIVVSPNSANTAYLPSGIGAIEKTVDGGLTWKGISPQAASQMAIAPSNPATLYAVFSNRMERSTDDGGSWGLLANLPAGTFFYFYGYGDHDNTLSIAIDPHDESSVVVAGYTNVLRTRDGGATWELASWEKLNSLVMDPRDSSTLYGVDSNGYLVRSTDQGSTWSPAGLTDLAIASIAAGGPRICAQTGDGAVYCSEEGGPWTGLVDGFQRTGSVHLTIDASGTHLASATIAGIWQYDIVGDDVHPQQLDSGASRLSSALAAQSVVVIPVAGTATGAGGLFTTELTITNGSPSSQSVIAVWLPAGGGVAQAFQFEAQSGTSRIFDAGRRFHVDGIGTLALFAADPSASIDASARIWTHRRGRAPLAEGVPGAGASFLSFHTTAVAGGLHQDAETRTNFGVVNLSADPHVYVARISGERDSGLVTLTVPGFSIEQVSVPNGDYGALSITVSADAASRWVFYGSSINRTTGEAHMSLGTTP